MLAEANTRRRAGLDRMQLKVLLMVLMVLDHIHYMYSDFLPVPLWFTVLGRLVAPTYLLLLADSFHYTHDRRKLFLRCWVVCFGMGSALFCMRVLGMGIRADGFLPENDIFANFPLLFCMWQGIDWIRERTPKKVAMGAAALAFPWVWHYLLLFIATYVGGALPLTWVAYAVIPDHTFIPDGGTPYLIEGLAVYLFRGHKKRQMCALGLTILAIRFFYYGSLYLQWYPDFNWGQMFTNFDYAGQWLSVFSLLLWALYNGKKGESRLSGRFFYWFYPAHVYLLYGLSLMIYPLVTR